MSKVCKGPQCAGMVVDNNSKYVPDYPGATAFRYKLKQCTRCCEGPTNDLCRICMANEQKTFETGKPFFVGRKDSHMHAGFHVEGTEWDEEQRRKNTKKLGKSKAVAVVSGVAPPPLNRVALPLPAPPLNRVALPLPAPPLNRATAKRRSSSTRASAKRRSSSASRAGSVAGFKARTLSSSEKRRRATWRKRGIYSKVSEIPVSKPAQLPNIRLQPGSASPPRQAPVYQQPGSASPPRKQYNNRAAATPLSNREKDSGDRLHINVREKRSSEKAPPLD